MKRLRVLALVMLIADSGGVQASEVVSPQVTGPMDSARLEKARMLVRDMRLRERFAPAVGNRTAGDGKLLDECMKANADPSLPEARKGDCIAKLTAFHQRFDPVADRLAPAARDKLVEAAAAIYARTFSAAQLDQLITFYRSPIGRRYAEAAPDMDKQLQAASVDIQLDFMIDVLGQVSKGKP